MRLRRRIAAAAGAVGAAAVLSLTACTGAPAGGRIASAPHSGAYPVAVAGEQVTRTPAVSAGGYALVAAGDPVLVHLGGADLRITAAGPDLAVPQPEAGRPVAATSAPGVLTVTVVSTRGTTRVTGDQFLGLNEEQRRFALHPDAQGGAVSPGHPLTLHLRSRFATGHTTLTWQPAGHPLITWDFTVEID